jgi:hypothetical protein
VGLSFVNLLVGLASGADTPFELFNEPKDKTFLLETRPFAQGTFKALFS